ncbi:MAG: glycine zipper 2TM domain-containing protein [Burkholderiales bacterium]|nr:glycine zipper 2TM domain-containing protein [Burkholderiales bacterium]
MNIKNWTGTTLCALAILALAGCGTMGDPFGTSSARSTNPGSGAYSGYGVVQSIELVRQNTTASTGIGGSGIGVGAIAGAVVGGVLGNQVGGGTGQTVATVAGAAGGAYVGNEIEKSQQQKTADAYKITVRMDSGQHQTVTQGNNAGLRVGDRVRIDNGTVQRY